MITKNEILAFIRLTFGVIATDIALAYSGLILVWNGLDFGKYIVFAAIIAFIAMAIFRIWEARINKKKEERRKI
jgi:hypothetical protein